MYKNRSEKNRNVEDQEMCKNREYSESKKSKVQIQIPTIRKVLETDYRKKMSTMFELYQNSQYRDENRR